MANNNNNNDDDGDHNNNNNTNNNTHFYTAIGRNIRGSELLLNPNACSCLTNTNLAVVHRVSSPWIINSNR